MQVIEELSADAREGLLNSAGGRFFGWVIGGGIPVSIAADWLTSAWDQNAGAYACAPSAAIIEEVVGGWLKDLLGLPKHASYAFVTGCQMAHVTALSAARHKVLANKGWSVEEQGMAGSPAIRVLVGEHHETLLRALRHLGIGTNAVVRVATKEDGTIDVAALEAELKKDPAAPTIVSLAAGDLNRGAFDPFDEVCDLVHAQPGIAMDPCGRSLRFVGGGKRKAQASSSWHRARRLLGHGWSQVAQRPLRQWHRLCGGYRVPQNGNDHAGSVQDRSRKRARSIRVGTRVVEAGPRHSTLRGVTNSRAYRPVRYDRRLLRSDAGSCAKTGCATGC